MEVLSTTYVVHNFLSWEPIPSEMMESLFNSAGPASMTILPNNQGKRLILPTEADGAHWKCVAVTKEIAGEVLAILHREGLSVFVASSSAPYYVLISSEEFDRALKLLTIYQSTPPSETGSKAVPRDIEALEAPLPAGTWEIVMMGTGSSCSCPRINCRMTKRVGCICNQRLNPSLLITRRVGGEDTFSIVVDVCKTFREACLQHIPAHGIKKIDAAILTHPHADAIGGLDDLREVQIRGTTTTVYSDETTKRAIKNMFPYLFPEKKSQLYVASVQHRVIHPYRPFKIQDLNVIPIPLWHGEAICLGYVFSTPGSECQFVYFSDFKCKSSQPPEEYPPPDKYGRVIPQVLPRDYENFTLFVDADKALEILKSKPISVMVLDCLDWGKEVTHVSHSDYVETVQIIRHFRAQSIEPQQVYFTGMGCTLDYVVLVKELMQEFGDAKVSPGFDGLKFQL